MSIILYKVLHILGLLMAFVALGGLTLHAFNGGTRETNRGARLVAVTHGIGLVLLLVSGFGLLARLGYGMPPLWAWLKILIWLAVGAALVAIRRMPRQAVVLWWGLVLIGTLAAYLGLYKPGA